MKSPIHRIHESLFACLLLPAVTFAAVTHHVDDDACPSPGAGTNIDPYCAIQTAIDAATDTDTILVQPGTYNEVINFNGKAITLRSSGGRDVTTIMGGGSVVKCVSGEGPDSVLDGFTITDGTGDPSSTSARRGGGMLNINSSPTVLNCTFENNQADMGGGMFTQDGNPTITNCILRGNSAEWEGGGMYNKGIIGSTIMDCLFENNKVPAWTGPGGGMRNVNSSMTLIRCDFVGNSTNASGGGISQGNGTIALIGCNFMSNFVSMPGSSGAIGNGGNMSLTDCHFEGNWAYYGPGAIGNGGNLDLTSCVLTGNSVPYGDGGAISHGSGALTLTDCLLENNFACLGSAIYGYSGSVSISQCVIQGNSANCDVAGIYNGGATLFVNDCVFHQNLTGTDVAGIKANAGDVIQNSTFSENVGYGYGTAVQGEAVLIDCLFQNNTGSAVFNPDVVIGCDFIGNNIPDSPSENGAGVRTLRNTALVNCRFLDNSAPLGGGVGVGGSGGEFGRVKIINCLFQGNSATGSDWSDWEGFGGGLYVGSFCEQGVADCPPPIRATATVINSTFADNTAAQGGGGIAVLDDGDIELINTIVANNIDDGGTEPDPGSDIAFTIRLPALNNSCVPGLLGSQWEYGSPPFKAGTVALTGSGNTGDDPLFASGPQGDFYLSQTASGQGTDSPCVDTGFGPATVLYAAGSTRTDGGNDGGTVDMGYHYDAAMTHRADNDGDGDVDGLDFSVFASCFNKSGNPPRTFGCSVLDAARFDFDNDRDIDGADFGVFAACFNKAGNPPRTPGCPLN
jgi:hypothetical protein